MTDTVELGSNVFVDRRTGDTEGRRIEIPRGVYAEGGQAVEAWLASQPEDTGTPITMDQPPILAE